MALLDTIAGVFTGGTGSLLKGIGDIIGQFKMSPEDQAKFMQETTKLANEHQEKMLSLVQTETDSYLKDIQSARDMQIESLKQQDIFSKRFVYYLTIFVIILIIGFDYSLLFINYPDKNRDIINFISGVLNSGGLIGIFNFFYGSSKSSEDKTKVMGEIMKNQSK